MLLSNDVIIVMVSGTLSIKGGGGVRYAILAGKNFL